MRILHVVKSYYPASDGGIEAAIAQLARATRPLGLRHHVFTVGPADAPAPTHVGGAALHRAHIDARFAGVDFTLSGMRRFAGLARRCDVVHFHFPWPCAHLFEPLIPAAVARVATHHADICRNPGLLRIYRPVLLRSLRRMHAVLTTSSEYAASSPILGAVDPARLHVVPLGLSAPPPAPDHAERVRRWRERVGEGFALFMGVLRYYKGLYTAIDALASSRQHLVVLGDGPEREAIQAHAHECGVADRLTLLGRCPEADKWALLELARCVVLPSTLRAEAFGLALVEAAAAGRPAITTALGTGTTHVVRHRETGLVVAPGDAPGLAGALEALGNHPRWAEHLGAAARARHRQHFTAERYGLNHLRVYEQVCPTRAPGRAALADAPAARGGG